MRHRLPGAGGLGVGGGGRGLKRQAVAADAMARPGTRPAAAAALSPSASLVGSHPTVGSPHHRRSTARTCCGRARMAAGYGWGSQSGGVGGAPGAARCEGGHLSTLVALMV